jgi:hypothetical protein
MFTGLGQVLSKITAADFFVGWVHISTESFLLTTKVIYLGFCVRKFEKWPL